MSATEETPRRLTPTERLHEVTMAAMSRAASPPEHTLELERDRNGNVLIRLAVRGADLDALLTTGAGAFDGLCSKYPRENGGTA